MLWLWDFTVFQVQTDIHVSSDAETKENHEESEKFSCAPIGRIWAIAERFEPKPKSTQNKGVLRPPVAPDTGHSGRSGRKPKFHMKYGCATAHRGL